MKDPTIRLQGAEKWPVVQSLVASEIWDEGIGYLVIMRQGPDEQLIFAAFLVDVYCLGVKNALWRTAPGRNTMIWSNTSRSRSG